MFALYLRGYKEFQDIWSKQYVVSVLLIALFSDLAHYAMNQIKKNSLPAHKLDEDLFKGFDLLHGVGKAEEACLGSTDCIFAFLEDDPAWG